METTELLLLTEGYNGKAMLENDFLTNEYIPVVWFSHLTPKYMPNTSKTIYSQKHLMRMLQF